MRCCLPLRIALAVCLTPTQVNATANPLPLQEAERAARKKPSIYDEDQSLEWRGGLAQKREAEARRKEREELVREEGAWGVVDCRDVWKSGTGCTEDCGRSRYHIGEGEGEGFGGGRGGDGQWSGAGSHSRERFV